MDWLKIITFNRHLNTYYYQSQTFLSQILIHSKNNSRIIIMYIWANLNSEHLNFFFFLRQSCKNTQHSHELVFTLCCFSLAVPDNITIIINKNYIILYYKLQAKLLIVLFVRRYNSLMFLKVNKNNCQL